MALQNFIDKVTTVATTWLNSVDVLLDTVFASATTKAAARAALTSDAPMSVAQGGTGATTAAAARTALGSTTVGDAVFITASAAAARTTLGAVGLTGDETVAGIKAFTGACTHTAAEAHSGIETHSNSEVFSGTPAINLTGGQIKFPATQNPSADVNTLDDYEEGTWTPSLGGTANIAGSTGYYTKIGRVVFIQGLVVVTTIGTGSTTRITGLPFNSAVGYSGFNIAYSLGIATAVVSFEAPTTGSNFIDIYSRTAAASSSSANAIFGNGTQIYFSGFYMTAT